MEIFSKGSHEELKTPSFNIFPARSAWKAGSQPQGRSFPQDRYHRKRNAVARIRKYIVLSGKSSLLFRAAVSMAFFHPSAFFCQKHFLPHVWIMAKTRRTTGRKTVRFHKWDNARKYPCQVLFHPTDPKCDEEIDY